MSVAEAERLMRMLDSGVVPIPEELLLRRLDKLRETNPGVVRAAARRLGASGVVRVPIHEDEWTNWIGEQSSHPSSVFTPTRVAALRAAMEQAVADGKRVKAVASGHSTSAAARPEDGGLAVDLGLLDRILKRRWEKPVLPAYATGSGTELVRVQSGITIRKLSQELSKRGLALPNSGTFDGQQLAGALCTGTHGSGLAFSTLADMVMSLEVLTVVRSPGGPKVRRLRIEPTNGITDPHEFRPMRDLIQDDEVFKAAVVSFGTMGVVVAMTLKVVKRFWMRETRQFMLWSDLAPQLEEVAGSSDHVDVHINPYRKNGDHSTVVIRRRRIPWRDAPPPDRPDDQDFVKFIAKQFGTDILGWFASRFPGMVADGIDRYCRNTETFTSASNKVLITGLGYDIEATSSEYAVSLSDGADMVQTVLDIAHSRRNLPKHARIRHSSPLGLRFVKGSTQWLSQHHDPENATLEIPFVLGTVNIPLALDTYADALSNARPHWGQWTDIDGSDAARLYGANWTKWKGVYRRFNFNRTFDNRFTKQLGLR